MSDIEFSEEEGLIESEISEVSDIEEKEKIIKQIDNYQKTFPDLINKKTIDKKNKKERKKYTTKVPLDTLKEDLKTIENEVNNNGMIKDMGGLCVSIASVIQNLSTKTRLKLNGPKIDLVSVVNNNKESYNQICKELMCKYDICGVTKPEVRLAMLGAQTIFLVHSENSREIEATPEVKLEEKKSTETV